MLCRGGTAQRDKEYIDDVTRGGRQSRMIEIARRVACRRAQRRDGDCLGGEGDDSAEFLSRRPSVAPSHTPSPEVRRRRQPISTQGVKGSSK